MNALSNEEMACFRRLVGFPEFLVPWLSRFFEIEEIRLLLDLAEESSRLSWSRDFLDRSYKRGVIDFDSTGNMVPADFHSRFEIWALFEGWQDIPTDIKKKLTRWEMESYQSKHEPSIRESRISGIRDKSHVWPEYALLGEAYAIVDRVAHIFQWPCNCRAIERGCKKPDYVCLRFSNDRDLGWAISKERAKELLHHAHKKGLMQNAELAILPDGSIDGAICACCRDCCFPQRLGSSLGVERLWPIVRHVVAFQKDKCTSCGRCASRCPFQAFSVSKAKSDGKRPVSKTIRFDSTLCCGCGLCESSCAEKAIELKPLKLSPLSIFPEVL